MNAMDLVFLNHRFHSLAFYGGEKIKCRALCSGLFWFINGNIIYKVINISLIIWSDCIIIKCHSPMSCNHCKL